ncbi:hypothetical protein [Candidatus Reidiella endopervernicosa]|uniref:Uncharacterized protein n=1 Tax=Candidatus Reidiella endopervernicosa TaxID=2738883 RepID=A0A6N0HY13_9GAMM|nr:hypothetical protein [Candidatus Reidiella endopervernicosa]QKQ27171.1 hypothetical protein HUE57_13380 [Candidatus Reidiella endopervernicosa]
MSAQIIEQCKIDFDIETSDERAFEDVESYNSVLLALHGRNDSDELNPHHFQRLFNAQRSAFCSPFTLGTLEYIEMARESNILDFLLDIYLVMAEHSGPDRDLAGVIIDNSALSLSRDDAMELLGYMLECELLTQTYLRCNLQSANS